MLILTIRTDKPEAELRLYQDQNEVAQDIWEAHRQLAETIHARMKQLLESNQKTFKDLQGIAVYQGPGSFTGLRIGIAAANAFADSLQIPIIASTGDNWQAQCIDQLLAGNNQKLIIPEYGALPHTTTPRK